MSEINKWLLPSEIHIFSRNADTFVVCLDPVMSSVVCMQMHTDHMQTDYVVLIV